MFTENETTTLPVIEPDTTIVDTTPEETILNGVVSGCVKLNVRRAPNATATVICTIPRDTEVVVFEEESTDEFYKIYTASGVEGFCMKQYITIES